MPVTGGHAVPKHDGGWVPAGKYARHAGEDAARRAGEWGRGGRCAPALRTGLGQLETSAVQAVLVLLALLNAACADETPGETAAPPLAPSAPYLYLPPAISPRVVFYHSFSLGLHMPELDRIDATVKGKATEPVAGLNGAGYGCPAWKPDKNPLVVQSPALGTHRPVTVMVWWRLDKPMQENTGFNTLTLRGKGLIGSFVRGKGKWCALPEPRRVFQVYYFPGIANRNDPWSEKIWITEPTWHHTAITVAAATDIRVYWDGRLKTLHSVKGRCFRPGDINHAVFGTQYGSHPMSVDDIVILDCVLTDKEIADYTTAIWALAAIEMPIVDPAVPEPEAQDREKPEPEPLQ